MLYVNIQKVLFSDLTHLDSLTYACIFSFYFGFILQTHCDAALSIVSLLMH